MRVKNGTSVPIHAGIQFPCSALSLRFIGYKMRTIKRLSSPSNGPASD